MGKKTTNDWGDQLGNYFGDWKGNLGGKIKVALGDCTLTFTGVNGLQDNALMGFFDPQSQSILVSLRLEAGGVDPATDRKILRYSYRLPGTLVAPVWLRNEEPAEGIAADWGKQADDFLGSWTDGSGGRIVIRKNRVTFTHLAPVRDGTYQAEHSETVRAIFVFFIFQADADEAGKKTIRYDPPVRLLGAGGSSRAADDPTETEVYEEEEGP